MKAPTGISRRIEGCIDSYKQKDFESALLHLFPAIDRTAKKRRSKDNVANRIKSFLRDESIIISSVATGCIFQDIVVEGVSIETAIYKIGRTSIAHEGELDPRLSFDPGNGIVMSHDRWNLPAKYILGMALSVVASPENQGEQTRQGLGLKVLGKDFELNEIWGNPEIVKQHICAYFQRPDLFEEQLI
ncbi:hypothetical protein [Pseudomonas vranovensis]|uniref:hypothetical protein n=1 Tax=Pseudomonas vranovensis TaxID=321661 RepID=UPI003D992450